VRSEAYEIFLDCHAAKKLLTKHLNVDALSRLLAQPAPRAVRSSSVSTIDEYATGWL